MLAMEKVLVGHIVECKENQEQKVLMEAGVFPWKSCGTRFDLVSIFWYYLHIIVMKVLVMPNIRPSSDLRNKYNEISEFCHKYSEPVFIMKNGQGDLAVMSTMKDGCLNNFSPVIKDKSHFNWNY